MDELKESNEDLKTAQETLNEVARDQIVRVLEPNHWEVIEKRLKRSLGSTAAHCAPACENLVLLNLKHARVNTYHLS